MKVVPANIFILLSLTVLVSCFPRRHDVTVEYKNEKLSKDETADHSVPEVTSSENLGESLSPISLVEYDSFLENEAGFTPYDQVFKRQGLHPCHWSLPNVSTIMGKVIIRAKCKQRTLFACTSSVPTFSKCAEVSATYTDPNGTLVSYVRDCVCAPSAGSG